ncbi:TPR-like protein [Rhizoctonia solani]|uniref:TPR-like protein n=1 Tax=Rhizoctonia solani TaxID=456999 RepID=A0A8H7H7E7_9AGAM|nr:TPR-like protein [Rhizoctonia solani]
MVQSKHTINDTYADDLALSRWYHKPSLEELEAINGADEIVEASNPNLNCFGLQLPPAMIPGLQEKLNEAGSLFNMIDQKEFAATEKYTESIMLVIHTLMGLEFQEEICLQSIIALCQRLKIDYDPKQTQDTRFPKLGVKVLQSTLPHIRDYSHASSIYILSELGNLHIDLFEHEGDICNIDESIEYHGQIMSIDTIGLEDIHKKLQRAAVQVANKQDLQGSIQNLQRALECEFRALELAPEGPEMALVFNNRGHCYRLLFERTRDLCDINASIEDLTKATSIIPKGYSVLPVWFTNLSDSYKLKFDHTHELNDCDQAIFYMDQAIAHLPEDQDKFSLPPMLYKLGVLRSLRFNISHDQQDLRTAIIHLDCAIKGEDFGSSLRPHYLNYRGNAQMRLFEYTESLDDLGEALEHLSTATKSCDEGDSDFPNYLSDLGIAHLHRFIKTHDHQDLELSINYQDRSVRLASSSHKDHQSLPGLFAQLGNAYMCRFEVNGQVEDVDKAIENLLHSVSIGTKSGETHMSLPDWYNNIGNAYALRFERIGEIHDIDKAIEYLAQAVALTPANHVDYADFLDNLGCAHSARFEEAGQTNDITRAIELQSEAVSIVRGGLNQNQLSTTLGNLGSSYIRQFEGGELAAIGNAIELHTEAISKMTKDSYLNAIWFHKLGKSYLKRFELDSQVEDIVQSINWLSQALETIPPNYPHIGFMLAELGLAHEYRYQRSQEESSYMNATECYRKASLTPSSRPLDKFIAARRWARLARSSSKSDCLEAFGVAMGLVPHVVWLGATLSQQYSEVQSIGRFASEAAAAAITHKEYSKALEWIEQGRSVVWSQLLRVRDPLESLHKQHPSLGEELKEIAKKLDKAMLLDRSRGGDAYSEAEARDHHTSANRYETVLATIRKLDGFEDFLLPKTASQLLPAAKYGPVVLLNVETLHCDALIIFPNRDTVGHIPLPNLSLDSVNKACSVLESYLQYYGTRSRDDPRRPLPPSSSGYDECDELADQLAMLWTNTAKPVLDYIQMISPSSSIPHITWCTTGSMTFLPLHAAGLYDTPASKMSDFAISSYTPTIGSLLSKHETYFPNQLRVLAIGQENTPGHAQLLGTREELSALSSFKKSFGAFKKIEESEATKSAVLAALEEYNCVHFACHACQATSQFDQSGFALHDGRLTLSEITAKTVAGRKFAFLSACQTAKGDKMLADEAVHLTSGLLVAGYSNVIGTMWSVIDEDAPLVAKGVYQELIFNGHTKGISGNTIASALHKGVNELRAKVGDREFYRWVPYIHVGI